MIAGSARLDCPTVQFGRGSSFSHLLPSPHEAAKGGRKGGWGARIGSSWQGDHWVPRSGTFTPPCQGLSPLPPALLQRRPEGSPPAHTPSPGQVVPVQVLQVLQVGKLGERVAALHPVVKPALKKSMGGVASVDCGKRPGATKR